MARTLPQKHWERPNEKIPVPGAGAGAESLRLRMITLPVVRAEKLTALWTANPKISAPIYSEPSTQSKTLGRIYQGASVKVYSFDPEWAYINSSGVGG